MLHVEPVAPIHSLPFSQELRMSNPTMILLPAGRGADVCPIQDKGEHEEAPEVPVMPMFPLLAGRSLILTPAISPHLHQNLAVYRSLDGTK